MKNLFTILLLSLLSVGANAQQQKPIQEPNTTVKDAPKPQRQTMTASYPVNAPVINENDPYYGRKEEFSRMFISNTLPVDFPRYQPGSSVDDYNIAVLTYLKSNTKTLIEKYKEKYEN